VFVHDQLVVKVVLVYILCISFLRIGNDRFNEALRGRRLVLSTL